MYSDKFARLSKLQECYVLVAATTAKDPYGEAIYWKVEEGIVLDSDYGEDHLYDRPILVDGVTRNVHYPDCFLMRSRAEREAKRRNEQSLRSMLVLYNRQQSDMQMMDAAIRALNGRVQELEKHNEINLEEFTTINVRLGKLEHLRKPKRK